MVLRWPRIGGEAGSAGAAAGSALLLEAASWSLLAKRRRITLISRELEEARAEGGRLRAQLREAARV